MYDITVSSRKLASKCTSNSFEYYYLILGTFYDANDKLDIIMKNSKNIASKHIDSS